MQVSTDMEIGLLVIAAVMLVAQGAWLRVTTARLDTQRDWLDNHRQRLDMHTDRLDNLQTQSSSQSFSIAAFRKLFELHQSQLNNLVAYGDAQTKVLDHTQAQLTAHLEALKAFEVMSNSQAAALDTLSRLAAVKAVKS